jgi:hypothetical protein
MIKEWLYFGCHKRPGHYLFKQGMHEDYSRATQNLSRFDGMLAPQSTREPYVAVVSRLDGWGCTALSFWDYSVDSRGGCNSIFFAPSLDISEEDMMRGAAERFPEVWNRLPQVKIHTV